MYAQKLVSKDDIDQKDKGTHAYSEHIPFTYSMRYKEVIKKMYVHMTDKNLM